jgi:Outer membrane efflux protein
VHQTTHALARFFNEVDESYKQFQAASRVRQAAAQRLDAMRADREAGRIPVDRFLDAVSRYAAAVSTEAQYRATYNIAIIALEEAKGTLLEYDKITVAGTSRETGPSTDHPVGGMNRTSPQPTAPGPVPSPTGPPAADPTGPAPVPPTAVPAAATGADRKRADAGKTYTFHLSIGVGSTPIEIRGSFTVAPAVASDAPGPGPR